MILTSKLIKIKHDDKANFIFNAFSSFAKHMPFSKNKTEKPMQKEINTENSTPKSFSQKRWKYTGQWMSDGAKPMFTKTQNTYTLSFKGSEAFADGKRFADFQIKNGLLVFENIENDFAKEGFYVLKRKAYLRFSEDRSKNILNLNPVDENGILVCDEGCELVFEKVAK